MNKQEVVNWFSANWFSVVQTIALLGTLLVTLITLCKNIKQTKVNTYLQITNAHRDLWSNIYPSKKLERVFTKKPDLIKKPITEDEKTFANLVFLHMAVCVRAIKDNVMFNITGVRADLLDILSYPIPQQVYEENKKFYDELFIAFVEETLKDARGIIKSKI